MDDRDIAASSEHPEASVKHIARGIVRQGLKPVPTQQAADKELKLARNRAKGLLNG